MEPLPRPMHVLSPSTHPAHDPQSTSPDPRSASPARIQNLRRRSQSGSHVPLPRLAAAPPPRLPVLSFPRGPVSAAFQGHRRAQPEEA
jgi:hypothetical protein